MQGELSKQKETRPQVSTPKRLNDHLWCHRGFKVAKGSYCTEAVPKVCQVFMSVADGAWTKVVRGGGEYTRVKYMVEAEVTALNSRATAPSVCNIGGWQVD